MFARRHKKTTWQKVKAWLWPSMGWRRLFQYFRYRMGRLKGTPHSIACGFAWGAAISMTPFMGFHIVLSILFAWVSRGGAVSAALGTVVGNPWTFPFIWEGTYLLGKKMLGHGGASLQASKLVMLTDSHFLEMLAHNFWSIIWPMSLGSFVLMPFVWVLFYFPMRRVISDYQKRRSEKIHQAFLLSLEKHRHHENQEEKQ